LLVMRFGAGQTRAARVRQQGEPNSHVDRLYMTRRSTVAARR